MYNQAASSETLPERDVSSKDKLKKNSLVKMDFRQIV